MRKLRLKFAVLTFAISVATQPAAAQLITSPSQPVLSQTTNNVAVTIQDINGAHVKFKYSGTTDYNGVPFVVLFPSSGVTPMSVQIALNPDVVSGFIPSSTYFIGVQFTTVDQTPPSTTGVRVGYQTPAQPPPAISGVVNTASLQPILAPGTAVSIFGSHLASATQSTTFDPTASYPTQVASTIVTFNGAPAPLLYVSPSQINAIVPFSLAGQTSAQVIVEGLPMSSAPVTAALQDTAPAIYTSDQSGKGQAVILQLSASSPASYNSSKNPAPAGEFLEIFATGQGVWTPPSQTDVFLFGELFTTQPVSLTIGGQPAKILYAGTIGYLGNWSLLQINAIVPAGLSPGPQPLVLKIGANDNSGQQTIIWAQ